MTENLSYLPAVSPFSAGSEITPLYYVYGYEGSRVIDAKAAPNYATYGVLYNWPAAMAACPSGWRLPSDEEWKVLEKNQGMTDSDADAGGFRGTVGLKLKEIGTTHWNSPNAGATNTSGFTALPGGQRLAPSSFVHLGIQAYFWSASVYGSSSAWYRILHYGSDGVYRNVDSRFNGFSVRCLQN